MGILDEDVVRVREASDLVAIASEHVALKKVGRRYQGLCPFHAEKSPSFSVNPELGLYYCFGCAARGDAITFLREVEHLDFADAVQALATRVGITLRYDDVSFSKERLHKARLIEAVGAAVSFFHDQLMTAKAAGPARAYLRGRGFDGEVAKRFQLGWAPDGFDALSRALRDQRFARDDQVGAGLAFVNRADRLQDQFRARLMFPIFDVRGDPVGFGGRTLDADQGPKYKNSPETPIYQKSRVLYGLNWAKGAIVARSSVIVCEGYTDVMAFALGGEEQAVATCGTALADDHFRVLKNFTRKVVLAYDADAAGQAAAERFYQWESRYEVDLQVADLPAGRDPADVWREDPAKLSKAVADARPFLQFRLDRLFERGDLGTAEGRAHVVEEASVLIAEHPSELVRDQYVMELSSRLGIAADVIRRSMARPSRPRNQPGQPGQPGQSGQPGRSNAFAQTQGWATSSVSSESFIADQPDPPDLREVEALRVAIHEPAGIADELSPALFAHPVAREAYEALASSATLLEAIDRCDGEARALLERLAVEEVPWGDDLSSHVASVVVHLVEAAGRALLDRLVRDGDDRSDGVKRLMDQLVNARTVCSWAEANRAAKQLVPLVSSPEEA